MCRRGLVTFNRLAVILLIIWLSSAGGFLTLLLLDLGPDLCRAILGNSSVAIEEWNWPLPVAIVSVQVGIQRL